LIVLVGFLLNIEAKHSCTHPNRLGRRTEKKTKKNKKLLVQGKSSFLFIIDKIMLPSGSSSF